MTTQDCPECQTALPVYQGYITWCDQCGWNLQEDKPLPPTNLLDTIYTSLNRRMSKGLFARLQKAPTLRPTFTWSKAIAYLIATLVHAFSLLLLALGIIFTFFSWPYLLVTAIGIAFLALAWLLVPKPVKFPSDIDVASRDDFPTLYALTATIAKELHAPAVDAIVVDERFNASFAQFGWTRKKVLFLGLPLLTVLDAQERVALIGHEIAHSVNGDSARSFYLGSAIHALSAWHGLMRPDYIVPRTSGAGYIKSGCLVIITNYLLRLIAWPILGLVFLMAQLLWRDSQRAEYLADAFSARVGGTGAAIGVLEKLQFRTGFLLAAQRVSTYFKDRDLFSDMRERLNSMPERERERMRRVSQLTSAELATSHPPKAYRVNMLRTHGPISPAIVMTEAEAAALTRELSTLERATQQKIVKAREERLY